MSTKSNNLTFYHDVYDPHSISMLLICRELLKRYGHTLQIKPMLVTNSSIETYGHKSAEYNIKDATLQCQYYEIPLNLPLSTDHIHQSNSELTKQLYQLSNAILYKYVTNTNTFDFLETAINISNILWNSKLSFPQKKTNLLELAKNVELPSNKETKDMTEHCLRDMQSKKHYLSGNIYVSNSKQKWFPRVDRLLFLLKQLNIKYTENERWNGTVTLKNPFIMSKDNVLHGSLPKDVFEVWVSFRSPYSWLIMDRIIDICNKNHLMLQLYPILPSIFRNVKITPSKGYYIGAVDCPRIAKYLQIPFGPACDPAQDKNGEITFDNINLCLMVFMYAKSKKKETQYFYEVMKAIWTQQIYVGSEQEMGEIINRIDGLDWKEYENAFKPKYLCKDEHLKWAEKNLNCLLDTGNWGVPTVRYKNQTHWGQDRLWALTEKYRRVNAKL